MKKLFILLVALLFIGCNKINSQLTKRDLDKFTQELQNNNEAIKNFDIETTYRYDYLSKKQGLSLDNYKEQGVVTLNAMKNRDKVQFTKFEILKPIKIFRCNNQFQGIVRQKSFVMVNGNPNPNSFEGYIIGISDDNIKWEFVNIGETGKKNVVKYYPFVCEEILKQIKN